MSRPKLGFFAHGCPRCGARYEEQGVLVTGPFGGQRVEPRPSRPCVTCRFGRPIPLWHAEAFAPRDCCRTKCRPVRDGDERLYLHVDRLAPDVPWFVCVECGRTHPWSDPAEEKVRAA